MNTRIVTAVLFLAAVTGGTIRDAGAASLYVDMIPGGAIDATLTKAPGDTFSVDIVLGATAGLAGFEFELGFDPLVLTANTVVSGGVFGVDTFLLDDLIVPGIVSFAELSTGSALDVVTPVVLATVNFTVSGLGTSPLDLAQTVLSDSLGEPIAGVLENDGALTSSQAPAPVPEPSAMSLLSLGLTAGLARSRWRARRRH